MRKFGRAASVMVVLLVGCRENNLPTSPIATPRALPLETVMSSKYSRIVSPTFVVITDAAAWQSFLARAELRPPAVAIDFSREMAIVAALGEQNDSCKSVEITAAVENGSRLAVSVDDQHFPPGCSCPPVIVEPVHVVKTARSSATPVFTTSAVTVPVNCP